MKINIRSYLNKYFWILQLLPGTLCLWNNNFTNWKSLASFIKRSYTNTASVCYQFLCMSLWAPCGFDGEWKTEGSLRGLGFERKKGNIWFQKAEVQIEATPMLLFPAEQPNKLLSTSTSSSKSLVLLELSEDTAVRPQNPLWGRGCQGCGRGCAATPASGQHQHVLHVQLSPDSCESKVLCGCWMGFERVKLLHLVPLPRFQQLVQADTGSFAARTLVIGASPAEYLCARWSGRAWEPGSSWEHFQAPVLVPFYPCFLIHFFSCTYTRVKAVFPELSDSTAFQAWGFFNVTWSKVLPVLPCRADASGAEWQHPHTPGLVPFLYQPCGDIQAVGIGTVWEIHEEHSQMEAGGWSPLLGFGIKCDFFFSDQDVN